MSDYDNFDDLDAVRDFRAGIGLLDPEVDDRIRRRIIELAVARGLVGGVDGPERWDETEGAQRSGVSDLPADRGQPPTSTSAGSRSSDGSATVVELHAAARPPARQPRMLVAAAAIVVVILVAGAVLVSRRGLDDKVDIANPPSSSSASGVTAAPLIDSVDALKVVLARQPRHELVAGRYVRTKDIVSYAAFPIPSPSGPELRGSLTYTLVQERGSNGFRAYDPSDSIFQPVDGGAPSTTIPPTVREPSQPFANLRYDQVDQLGRAESLDQVRSTMLGTEVLGTENYDVIVNELQLLRLPIVSPAVRALLVDALTDFAFGEAEGTGLDGTTFRLVLRNDADETVTVRFDATSGNVLGWDHAGSGGAVIDRLEVVDQPQVLP